MPDDGTVMPREVARMLRVHVTTLRRNAVKWGLEFFRTPGGHRRYFRASVVALMRATGIEPEAAV